MTTPDSLPEKGFYNALAEEYDELTGAAGRAQAAERFAEELTRRYAVTSAVDAACGTGLFARALARRGVKVTGADISVEMIRRGREHPECAGLDIEWIEAPMQDLAERLPQASADAVLCLGNSLPHLLTDDDLRRTLRGFFELLKPGGVALVHLLNYNRVLAHRERLVGVTRAGDREYVRFYDFLDGLVRFNALSIRWRGEEADTQWRATELRPYRVEELTAEMTEAGFANIERFARPIFDAFDPEESDTVMVVGKKIGV